VSDIVERLRASVTQCRAVDRSALLAEAADEIERLRCNPTGGDSGSVALTDAEREAVEWFACYGVDRPLGHSTTLRGLLERTK